MNNNPLNVHVAGLELGNPTLLASGILGYTAESLQRVIEGGAGAVVTKSVGVAPRMGYANPTVVQANDGLINAMGLPNPGIDNYVDEIIHAKTVVQAPLIVSVFGYSADEYAQVAHKVRELRHQHQVLAAMVHESRIVDGADELLLALEVSAGQGTETVETRIEILFGVSVVDSAFDPR